MENSAPNTWKVALTFHKTSMVPGDANVTFELHGPAGPICPSLDIKITDHHQAKRTANKNKMEVPTDQRDLVGLSARVPGIDFGEHAFLAPYVNGKNGKN